VTCPKLKTTECGHCGRNGHTARYCGEWGAEKRLSQAAAAAAKKSRFDAGGWMDAATGPKEHPGFESPRVSRKKVITPSAPKLASRFAGLDIETGEEHNEPVVPRELGPTWAQVAQGVAKEAAEDSDDELPPLVWGKITTARWGDVSA